MSSFLVGWCPNDMGTGSEIGSSRHVMLTSEGVKVVFPHFRLPSTDAIYRVSPYPLKIFGCPQIGF